MKLKEEFLELLENDYEFKIKVQNLLQIDDLEFEIDELKKRN